MKVVESYVATALSDIYVPEIFTNPIDPQSLTTAVAGRPRNVAMGRTRTAR